MIVKCPTCQSELATKNPAKAFQDIQTALATVRREAFKEAADLAERLDAITGKAIAQRIRALEASASGKEDLNG